MTSRDLTGQLRLLEARPNFTGNYSYVYHGKYRGHEVAIKVIKAVSNTTLTTMRRKVKREREVWAALQHPNILPFYGFAEDTMFEPYGALVSPWCSYGDTEKFFARYGEVLTNSQRIDLWKGTIAGVNYLHSHNPILVHGDIKPGNVLVDQYGKAVLCDFGLVRIFLDEGSSGMTTTTAHTGTERYLAPELVTGDEMEYPSTASDVYALGCIGLEFIFDQKVYAHRKHNLRGCLIDDIASGMAPATEPEDITPETRICWEVIQACWISDPSSRPLAWQMFDVLDVPSVETPQH